MDETKVHVDTQKFHISDFHSKCWTIARAQRSSFQIGRLKKTETEATFLLKSRLTESKEEALCTFEENTPKGWNTSKADRT